MSIKDIQKKFYNDKEYLLNKKYNIEYKKLINDIKDAILEIEKARNIFNNVSDSHLIEVAIYAENVAQKRYEYLLSLAKGRYLK